MVRNKRDKSYDRQLLPNSLNYSYPDRHVTTVSIDKYSTRPPIYRKDGSPNEQRFEVLNLLPNTYTKMTHTASVNISKTCGRSGELFKPNPYQCEYDSKKESTQ